MQPSQRFVGVRDLHRYGNVLAVVHGDADPAWLARRQRHAGDKSRFLRTDRRRPVVVGPGIVIERQNPGEIAAPISPGKRLIVDLRSTARPVGDPLEALGRGPSATRHEYATRSIALRYPSASICAA